MARTPDQSTSTTLFPDSAVIRIGTGTDMDKMDDGTWNAVSIDAYNTIRASIDARDTLEQNLRTWLALVEADVSDEDEADDRWEDCANLFIPTPSIELNAMVSYLAAQIFTNRFIIVTGNTEEAAQTAPDVERYYNAEIMRERGETTWYNDLLTTLYLGLRDGACPLGLTWNKTVKKVLTPVFDTVFDTDPETGEQTPRLDKNGEIVSQRRMVEQTITTYDDVQDEPLQLRDFGLIPSTAPSVNAAVAAWKTVWFYEDQLKAMCQEGEDGTPPLMKWDECDKALSYVPSGSDEVASDSQGSYNKTMGRQVDTGLGQGSLTSPQFKNRGPIKCFQLHTRQFDFNGDGDVEENVIWIHEQSQRMLGWCPDEYVVAERPFKIFCPFPRPGSAFGYSLIEWLAALTAEINAIHNQRRDAIDLHLSPPFLEKPSVEITNKGRKWGPNATWYTDDMDAIKVLQLPPLPPDSTQEEASLQQIVGRVTGNDAPAIGVQSSGRRSATESRQRQAAQSTRSGLVAMRFRHFCRSWINYTHRLKLQYLQDNPSYTVGDQKYTVSREVLARDYKIDIAGASDPVDAATRRQEFMAFFGILAKVPQVAGKPTRFHRLLQKFCDVFDIVDADAIIGTDQDAAEEEQQLQAQQAAAAAQAGQPGAQPGQPPGQPGARPGAAPPKPNNGARPGLEGLVGGAA